MTSSSGFQAKELSIRENLEEAMRERNLVQLEAALIEYRNMLKKRHSQFAEQNVLKEARALGLQLRSEEQVLILTRLKEAVEKNDYEAAEANVEMLQVFALFELVGSRLGRGFIRCLCFSSFMGRGAAFRSYWLLLLSYMCFLKKCIIVITANGRQ